MAYNKFKLSELKTKLNLKIIRQEWLIKSLPIIEDDDFLLKQMEQAKLEALNSEKARSEFIIAPIFQAFRRKNPNKFSLFSGYQFDVDRHLDLNGFCDFIFSLVPNSPLIESPVFCVVEAKKEDIDENSLAQCGAEMYASQLFNQKNQNVEKIIYGCVTTAYLWCFLKLEGSDLLIDPNYVPLTFDEPNRVLAVLQWILDESLKSK